jgi:alpha-1,2-mannosyltransferase
VRGGRILDIRMRARRSDLLALAIIGVFIVPMTVATLVRPTPPVDLAVYLQAGRMFATGGGLYGTGWGSVLAHPLPYTYPPLWAAMVVPFAWLHWRIASLMWLTVNLALLVWIVRLSYRAILLGTERPRRIVLAGLVVVLAVTTPLGSVFWFGQVGILLTAACLADTVPERTILPRGVLVGFATAVKMTPGIFVLYWVVTRRWRAAIVSAATSVGLWLVTAAIRPDLSREFWTGVVLRTDRAGDPGFVSNQSLYGALIRSGWSSQLLWVALVVAALIVGLRRASEAHMHGDELTAVAIVGLTSLLVSPISWIDHAVWIVPASGVLLDDGRDAWRRAAWAMMLVLFLLRLPDWVASHQLPIGPAFAPILEDSYLLGYFALILFLPIRRMPAPGDYVSVGSATPS